MDGGHVWTIQQLRVLRSFSGQDTCEDRHLFLHDQEFDKSNAAALTKVQLTTSSFRRLARGGKLAHNTELSRKDTHWIESIDRGNTAAEGNDLEEATSFLL